MLISANCGSCCGAGVVVFADSVGFVLAAFSVFAATFLLSTGETFGITLPMVKPMISPISTAVESIQGFVFSFIKF